MLTSHRTLLSAALILALGAVAPFAVSAPAAAATGLCAAREQPNEDNAQPIRSNYQDIQGENQVADPAVGVPAYGSGVVDLSLYAPAGPQRVTEATFTGLPPASSGDRFGAAVGYLDLDADVCHDLAIGAPGAGSGTGAVIFAVGGASGIQTAGAIRVVGRSRGEHFGSAIATLQSQAIGKSTVYIGAPDRSVNGKARAGAVDVYTVDETTTGAARVAYVSSITQDSPNVPGVAEAGDRFGSVLAQGSNGELVVGDPSEAVGSKIGAGTVTVLGVSRGAVTKGAGFGYSGGSQAFDRFGSSLGIGVDDPTADFGSDVLAVGAPGRTVNGHRGAGVVQTFTLLNAVTHYSRTVSQDSLRVPGAAEAGDHFGASVQVGRLANCDSFDGPDLVIGSPGEDVGSRRDAGSMTITSARPYVSNGQDHGVASWCQFPYQQGTGNLGSLHGSPENGDATGTTVSLVAAPCTYDRVGIKKCAFDVVQVASPGEDVGSLVDVGGVTLIDINNAPYVAAGHGYSGGRQAYQRYGSVGGSSPSSLGQ